MTKKKQQKPSQRNFIFRKHVTVGAADALDDRKFLKDSFVDNGGRTTLELGQRK